MIAASEAATMKRSTAAAAITAMLSQLSLSKVDGLPGPPARAHDARDGDAAAPMLRLPGMGEGRGRGCARAGGRHVGLCAGRVAARIGRVCVVAHAAPCPVAAGYDTPAYANARRQAD